MLYKKISSDVNKLRELILGETNVNNLKETIKYLDLIEDHIRYLKVNRDIFYKYTTDSYILNEVSKEIQENKLIRLKKYKQIYNSWIDYMNQTKGETNVE